mmetsp:Transcript_32743/g.82131  ORF Transcript_32743/g.82131 Transcript_32743/m.82131 type:complete len:121 (-) Transcript_32743:243-605(-)|eukprot:jgi/Tetstr1/448312/TSEL_035596.t1
MLAALARSTAAASGLRALVPAAGVSSARMMSGFGDRALQGIKGISEKEMAVENAYFNKEDERLLRKILKKVKTVSDVTDEHAAVGIAAQEMSSLKAIVDKYNVSQEDLNALIEWRHHHEH